MDKGMNVFLPGNVHKSCVISCTNAHPLHICLIGSWNYSHFPNSPRQWTLQLHTGHRQPLVSLLFQALSHLSQLLLVQHLYHASDTCSTSQHRQQGVTIPWGWHTTELAHTTWSSSNTITGLFCSPCETSSLYFPSWAILSPDLCPVCNDVRFFGKLSLVQGRNKCIWKSIILPLLAEASFAPVLPSHPGSPEPSQLLSVSPGPSSPSGDKASQAQNSALQPLLCRSVISTEESGSQKIPEGLLWYCKTWPLAFLPAWQPLIHHRNHLIPQQFMGALSEAPGEQCHQNLENSRSPPLHVHELLKTREEEIYR